MISAFIPTRGKLFIMMERITDVESDLKQLEYLKSDHAVPLREQLAELKSNRKL